MPNELVMTKISKPGTMQGSIGLEFEFGAFKSIYSELTKIAKTGIKPSPKKILIFGGSSRDPEPVFKGGDKQFVPVLKALLNFKKQHKFFTFPS
jgi:hypothetical protein